MNPASVLTSLLVAHFVGDYLLQNDKIAQTKTSSTPWCVVHVALYTLACVALTLGQMPWWAYVSIAVPHFFIDRFRFARTQMRWAGQESFATGVFSPWSIIVVDNVDHLLCLWLTWVIVYQ